jgi:hypothetical protein
VRLRRVEPSAEGGWRRGAEPDKGARQRTEAEEGVWQRGVEPEEGAWQRGMESEQEAWQRGVEAEEGAWQRRGDNYTRTRDELSWPDGKFL